MDQTKPDIILIAYYFPPSNAIGGVRPYRFYKYLKRLGYKCTVVTASAQEPAGSEDVIVVPDNAGEIWESPQKPTLTFGARCEWLVRRFVFPGAVGIMWAASVARVCRELLRGRHRGRPVVLYTTFPPLGTLLAGLLIMRRKRVAGWICDYRDPFFVGGSHDDRQRLGHTVARWMENSVFRTADALVANTTAIAREWLLHDPGIANRVHIIFNGFDPEQRLHARAIPPRKGRTLLHAGELYGGRKPTVILQSLARLRKASPEVLDARIVLQGSIGRYGDMPPELVEEAVREGWLEIRDVTIPRVQAERLVTEADGLLLLQPQSAIQIPGKLFEYICVGRPILALAPKSSAVEQVLAGAGIPFRCVYPDDPPELADRKILEYLSLPSPPVRFSEQFESEFSVVRQTDQLRAIIDAVAGVISTAGEIIPGAPVPLLRRCREADQQR